MRKVSRKAFLENAAVFKRDMKKFENTKNPTVGDFDELKVNNNSYYLGKDYFRNYTFITNYFANTQSKLSCTLINTQK